MTRTATCRALGFAAAGLLALGTAPAAAAPVAVEAENLTLTSGSGRTLGDAVASGGRALEIWSTASATGAFTARATRRVAVRARGQACEGAPRMRVGVDGRTVFETAVGTSTWTEYAGDVSLADGAHTLTVGFVNDHRTATCDRNLFVDVSRFTSVAARPLPGAALYVDPASQARAQADAWRLSRPLDAALLDRIADRPQAFWLGDWSGDVRAAVDGIVTRAAAAGRVPVLVAYDVPQRDCGSWSAGGADSADAYRTWIRAFAAGIGARRAIVVVEPDAVAGLDCLGAADRAARLELLADATRVLAGRPATAVYLDGGHDAWQPAAVIADRLRQAGAADAQGFALNVSNFRAQAGLVTYGQQVAAAIGVAHFVVDTSRNGAGPPADGAWCNPPGRRLGVAPGTPADHRLDWNLWIKRPGESDGPCNGGPSAGAFWPQYALGLAAG